MRFYKELEIGENLRIGLFGDVYHLFEHENIISLADESWYNAYSDPTGTYDDPTRYSADRYMRFGLSLKW